MGLFRLANLPRKNRVYSKYTIELGIHMFVHFELNIQKNNSQTNKKHIGKHSKIILM